MVPPALLKTVDDWDASDVRIWLDWLGFETTDLFKDITGKGLIELEGYMKDGGMKSKPDSKSQSVKTDKKSKLYSKICKNLSKDESYKLIKAISVLTSTASPGDSLGEIDDLHKDFRAGEYCEEIGTGFENGRYQSASTSTSTSTSTSSRNVYASISGAGGGVIPAGNNKRKTILWGENEWNRFNNDVVINQGSGKVSIIDDQIPQNMMQAYNNTDTRSIDHNDNLPPLNSNFPLKIRAIEGPLHGSIVEIPVSSKGATGGRHSGSNLIVISESYVSRKHFRIGLDNTKKRWYTQDLGSTTGTFIMLRESTEIKDNTIIQVGIVEIVCNILSTKDFEAKNSEAKFFIGGPSPLAQDRINAAEPLIEKTLLMSFLSRQVSCVHPNCRIASSIADAIGREIQGYAGTGDSGQGGTCTESRGNLRNNPLTDLETQYTRAYLNRMNRCLTIGRDIQNSIQIPDIQISAHHAEIHVRKREVGGRSRDNSGIVSIMASSDNAFFEIVDNVSTNRTWIRLSPDGVESEKYYLEVGDVIKVGSSLFMIMENDNDGSATQQAAISNRGAASSGASSSGNGHPAPSPPIQYTNASNLMSNPANHLSGDFNGFVDDSSRECVDLYERYISSSARQGRANQSGSSSQNPPELQSQNSGQGLLSRTGSNNTPGVTPQSNSNRNTTPQNGSSQRAVEFGENTAQSSSGGPEFQSRRTQYFGNGASFFTDIVEDKRQNSDFPADRFEDRSRDSPDGSNIFGESEIVHARSNTNGTDVDRRNENRQDSRSDNRNDRNNNRSDASNGNGRSNLDILKACTKTPEEYAVLLRKSRLGQTRGYDVVNRLNQIPAASSSASNTGGSGNKSKSRSTTNANAAPTSSNPASKAAPSGAVPSGAAPKQEEDRDLCKICYDGPLDCCLYPCGHVVACQECTKQISECPVCRFTIAEVIKMFRV